MAKMVVMDVDLGQSIDDIINEDVDEMTEQTRQIIDEAVDQKKMIDSNRKAQAQLKAKKELNKQKILETIYETLLEAYNNNTCLSLDEMGRIAEPTITNASALILQMKSFIRKEKGNEYVLKRHTKDGKSVYILLPFNAE